MGANIAHLRATSVSEWSPHSLTLVALTKLAPKLGRTHPPMATITNLTGWGIMTVSKNPYYKFVIH